MKELFACADQYVQESDWKDLALIKFCLCSIGVMIGLAIPKERKKLPLLLAAAVFVVTYIPLMMKLIKIIIQRREQA
ncbi:permease of phosphate ABC transporter [Lactonifactor longoviformis]|uniref:Permease of phosphate ABC transporter n=1 Tax=Lactonifactor longoviformis DSM 17459 TaxID=1122155 RepID=A0A1M5AZW2_9CLOT|nr:permease of phosphate ABC transporter [Lactonifactor longoviformis]POP31351.1 permease of phosphate ABC transporter [Lactonifactor longoviformis]SHF35804.1 hypothetical protein SAMN02745158_03413 [Lactonifactor longoviformis DSM 17459]